MKFYEGDRVKITPPKFHNLKGKVGTVIETDVPLNYDYRVRFDGDEGWAKGVCFYERELALADQVGDFVELTREWSDGKTGFGTIIEIEEDGWKFRFRIERTDGLVWLCSCDEFKPAGMPVEDDLAWQIENLRGVVADLVDWVEDTRLTMTQNDAALAKRIDALEQFAVAITDEQPS